MSRNAQSRSGLKDAPSAGDAGTTATVRHIPAPGSPAAPQEPKSPPGKAARRLPQSTLWIRNAWWDGFWILSGFPIGLALVLLSPGLFLMLAVMVLLEHAHFLSPMTLAWSHAGFRGIMLRRPMKFIGVPLAIILTTTAIGVATSLSGKLDHLDIGLQVRVHGLADYAQPFVMLVVLYFLWNGFHFGMQNFGVLSIYRRKSGSGNRRADLIYCVGLQAASMVMAYRQILGLDRGMMRDVYAVVAVLGIVAMLTLEKRWSPRILFILADAAGLMLFLWSGLWGFAIWSVNHWLVAIGLSSHVHAVDRQRSPAWFIGGLLVAGVALFWLFYGVGLNAAAIFDPKFVVRSTMILISVRYGVAFTHFLYDRWLWQFSNPDVQATVGKQLFTPGWTARSPVPGPGK